MTNDKDIINIVEQTISSRGQIDLTKYFPSLGASELDRVTSLITGKGKYMLDKTPLTGAWVLRKNPAYKNQLAHDFKLSLITAALTLLVGYILWLIDNRSKNQEIQQIKEQLQKVSDKVNQK